MLAMDISVLEGFAKSLQAKFSLPGTASPEDQLKAPVEELLKDAGAAFGMNVESRTEAHLTEHKVRPDIAIYVGKLICGYIELKAPGLGADAPKLKGAHNVGQWKKLKGLPNLIYTDGRDWALYRGGKRQGVIVRLDDDPTARGKKAVSKANVSALDALLRDFLVWAPIVPHKPKSTRTISRTGWPASCAQRLKLQWPILPPLLRFWLPNGGNTSSLTPMMVSSPTPTRRR